MQRTSVNLIKIAVEINLTITMTAIGNKSYALQKPFKSDFLAQ